MNILQDDPGARSSSIGDCLIRLCKTFRRSHCDCYTRHICTPAQLIYSIARIVASYRSKCDGMGGADVILYDSAEIVIRALDKVLPQDLLDGASEGWNQAIWPEQLDESKSAYGIDMICRQSYCNTLCSPLEGPQGKGVDFSASALFKNFSHTGRWASISA